MTAQPVTNADLLIAIEERVAPIGTARLGVLLHALRESRKLAVRQIALLPELRSELEDVEAGRARPDTAMVATLLRCYDADLDALVPSREPLVANDGTEKEVLAKYREAVRRWPGSIKRPQLREGDFKVLAGILRTDPKDVHQSLRRHAIGERVALVGTARLGFLVDKLRSSSRSGRGEVEIPPELEADLEEISAGRRRADATTLESLLSGYGAHLDELVPPRETLVVIDGTEKEVLTRYLAAMRRWRGSGKAPQLRDADLRVLAGILGTDPREIERRLRKLTGCSRRRARRLTATLMAAAVVAPAAGLLHSLTSPASATVQAAPLPQDTQSARAGSTAVQASPAVSTAAVAPAIVPVTTVVPAAVVATTAVAPTIPTTAPLTVEPTTSAPTVLAVHAASAATAPTAAVHTFAADCDTALAYLAAHAKPGFAHYCRPGPIAAGIQNAVAYTCVPGSRFSCPDGNAEIIIADPGCAASYENEASNSYWDFSTGAVIRPGATQDGRTWDPFGGCP